MKQEGLPYYLSYPFPIFEGMDESITKDLEYLQQMYPKKAKAYQKLVYDTLELLDYEGSVIYDEYPDRLQLENITEVVVNKITQQEEIEEDAQDMVWLREVVQLVLYYEIYKRRHKDKKIFPYY